MKKIFILVGLTISLNSFCQDNQDSLAKYSYSIVGFTLPKGGAFGSGFFIKNKNSLYLVTAKHVLTGCGNYGVELDNMPKSMNVFIKGPPLQAFNINTEIIKKDIPCKESFYDSDFIVTIISNQFSNYVNSVEKLISPPYKNVKQVSIFGYPEYIYGKGNDKYYFINPISMNLHKKIYGFYVKEDSLKNINNASCFFEVDKFMEDYDSLGGFSGSPIFVQDDTSKKWRILGVFTGSGINYNGNTAIWFVPIEIIMNKINR